MHGIAIEEVQSVFAAAKNLNAALKTFIKREVRSGDPIERFAKDFRVAVATGRAGAINSYIERQYPKNEAYFVVLARYAHAQLISSLVENIFNRFADEFNGTYEKGVNAGIRITNHDKFVSIVGAVEAMIDEWLTNAGLPKGELLRKSVLMSVFDSEVLEEVLKVRSAKS